MPKYIDGEKLRNRISAEYTNCTAEFVKGFSEAFRLWNEELERMMKEESNVQEVKHGKWIDNGWGDYIKICSCCGRSPLSKQNGKPYYSKFCPFCGAEMNEAKDNDE